MADSETVFSRVIKFLRVTRRSCARLRVRHRRRRRQRVHAYRARARARVLPGCINKSTGYIDSRVRFNKVQQSGTRATRWHFAARRRRSTYAALILSRYYRPPSRRSNRKQTHRTAPHLRAIIFLPFRKQRTCDAVCVCEGRERGSATDGGQPRRRGDGVARRSRELSLGT